MHIGVDFDNTIVCYDTLFHQVALEQNHIPPELPASKGAVRDYLRQCGQEDTWTAMQGYVYGPRMQEAAPFPGVIDFFLRCQQQGVAVCIISHKTRHPFRGPAFDLHQSARGWLEHYGFFDPAHIGLSSEQVFFELTKQEKIQRIASVGCTHFIDDLPEFLAEAAFPPTVERLLFDPNQNTGDEHGFRRFTAWTELAAYLL
jgi:nucleoside-diphosphate-sugar epimerase